MTSTLRYSFSGGIPIMHKNTFIPKDGKLTSVSFYGIAHDILHHYDGDFTTAGEVTAFGMISADYRCANGNRSSEDIAYAERHFSTACIDFWGQHSASIEYPAQSKYTLSGIANSVINKIKETLGYDIAVSTQLVGEYNQVTDREHQHFETIRFIDQKEKLAKFELIQRFVRSNFFVYHFEKGVERYITHLSCMDTKGVTVTRMLRDNLDGLIPYGFNQPTTQGYEIDVVIHNNDNIELCAMSHESEMLIRKTLNVPHIYKAITT